VLSYNEEMNSEQSTLEFLTSDGASLLHDRLFIEQLLTILPLDSALLYDLTFRASFAKKLFAVLRREGTGIQGYERMQQTLAESVQELMKSLQQLENEYHVRYSIPLSAASIMQVIDDLTIVKEWMNTRTDE
jgi:hypothetical protein